MASSYKSGRAALSLAAALAAAPAAAMVPADPVPPARAGLLAPVVIDPGHGGEDMGAVVGGTKEKDLALDISRRLRDRLAAAGAAPVVMTREDDVYIPLDRRVVDSVDWSGALFVSVHLNQVKSRKASGLVVYSYGPQPRRFHRPRRWPSVPPMPPPPVLQARESALLGRALERALREGGFAAKSDRSDYYVLKNPSQPSVLLELGYLSNPEERARLEDPAYRQRLAETLAHALERYSEERVLKSTLADAG